MNIMKPKNRKVLKRFTKKGIEYIPKKHGLKVELKFFVNSIYSVVKSKLANKTCEYGCSNSEKELFFD